MLLNEIERISKIVKSIIKQKKVKIFAQFDTDGLSSASIFTKMLLREGLNFELRILKQLTRAATSEIQANENDFLVFLDFGSGQLELLKNFLDTTHILVIDHHEPAGFDHLNLFHINPLLFGEDEMSASVITYIFAKFLNQKNTDLIDVSLIGAIGDQADEKWEFKGLIKKILAEAETVGKVSKSVGLRFYGRMSRPIHKSLAYTFDPFIPRISGSESNAIQFLSEIGIKIKQDDEWVKLNDLSIEDQQKLAAAIILERMGTEEVAEDIFGEIYTLLGRPEEIQDAREFATTVNACGRMGVPHVGIRLLLGDYSVLEKSYSVLDAYRKILGDSMNWIRENSDAIVSTEFANFILGKDKIPDTVIGTVISMVSNSGMVQIDKPVFGFSDAEDGMVKISARITRNTKNLNLKPILSKSTAAVQGEGGGHASAAGGLIPKGKEHEYIKIVDSLFGEMIAGKES